MSKRKILSLAMALSMVAILAMGATLAYFTDTDEATNVFTVGNVKNVQNETDRNGDAVDYSAPEASETPVANLFPIVNDSKVDGYHMGKNYLDKFVTVTNEGNLPAYVRTYVAFPAELDDGDPTFDASKNYLHWNGASAGDDFDAAQDQGDLDNSWYWTASNAKDWPAAASEWNAFQIKDADGMVYNVYVATHDAEVPAGKTTAPNLMGVYLDKDIDNKEVNGETKYVRFKDADNEETINYDLSEGVKVLVVSEAVQTEGFTDAWTALDQAFGAEGTYCPFEGYELV